MRLWIILAGLNGLMGVAMSALGAHAFPGNLTAQGWASLGAQFQLIHAVALLAGERMAWSVLLFNLGIAAFCGSLYLKAFGLADWLPGLVTPAGGMCLMAGWLTMAVYGLKKR
ncbi:DUF423 domain-containing protein [Magnetospirillum moscoviense]|uniref:DUF423 domain-containing protein n=1 Tax=Magnetospirillum moscoviense TaxID=1437059 RepID=A0A178MPZ9_9PROT|nr:DUF423 domain-containing protein [Magnetospirillum moscoviense]MBF0323994.1 DUF423 domain-containing protein [Alphaproteobacteria bacterium]OAN50786.1 hypothetical protein A6A05_11745 [Magnetospirillum moscoviense]